jgi:uncharacterized protein (TIGR03067 family)
MNHLAVWTTLGVIFLTGGPNLTEAVKKDKAALQGAWRVVGSESNGEKVPADDLKDLFLLFGGDSIFVRESGKTSEKFSFLLDPTKKPKQIDLAFTDGPNKGRIDQAIYRLDGDKLFICIQQNKDSPRPRDFVTAPKSHLSLVILQRSKE